MEKAAQPLSDILQWDINSWRPALNFWDENVNWSEVKTCLDLGAREGGLSLWLALKGCNVVCSDYANSRATAEPLHTKFKVSERITYQDIDASAIPYENHFDLVVFKSIIGGIGKNNNLEIQKKVFNEIYKSLKPGGKLLFAENLVASPIHQKFRNAFTNWGDSWRYVSLNEIKQFLTDFSSYEMFTNGVVATFGRSEKQRQLLSYADKYAFNVMMPERWKYIVYGIATK